MTVSSPWQLMHTHAHIEDLNDLRPRLLDEIEAFFTHYNQQKGKAFKPLNRCKPKKARRIIDHGMAVYLWYGRVSKEAP